MSLGAHRVVPNLLVSILADVNVIQHGCVADFGSDREIGFRT